MFPAKRSERTRRRPIVSPPLLPSGGSRKTKGRAWLFLPVALAWAFTQEGVIVARSDKISEARRVVGEIKAAAEETVAKALGRDNDRLARPRNGRPAFEPTAEQRKNVETLAGLGMPQEQICLLVEDPHTGKPISDDALRRLFPLELERGPARFYGMIGQSLAARALNLKHPQGAMCAIWLSKARMGWKDKSVVEFEGRAGVLVAPAQMSPQQWIEAANDRAAGALEPGADDRED